MLFNGQSSEDNHPWKHPFLTQSNISKFRSYSADVWQFALEYDRKNSGPLNAAFSVNMAQNMYKWARLSKKYGWDATLYLHPQDSTLLSDPRWEEYDGEIDDLSQSVFKTRQLDPISLDLTVRTTVNQAVSRETLSQSNLTLSAFEEFPTFNSYFYWAKELADFDVIYTASGPFASYASGRPYCAFSVGGDLQFDCGRRNEFGNAMLRSFDRARFLMVSNPHTLGHSRRLGLTNGVYLPYPMDTERYCPGPPSIREQWIADYGGNCFILTTARLDAKVKGYSKSIFEALRDVAINCPNVRFLMLSWGASAEESLKLVTDWQIADRFIFLPPVGKRKLIHYYRSCDLVLDQFIYGYYGATMLEAAACGKPVVMFMRSEQYEPLYSGDIAPIINVSSAEEVREALEKYAENILARRALSRAMRKWVCQNHGEERLIPLMLALLKITARDIPLPEDLINPLKLPLTEEENAYHQDCLQRET